MEVLPLASNNVNDYKYEILKEICLSEEAVKIIDSQSPKYDPEDPYSLIKNNLFTYLKNSETVTIADLYIFIAVDFVNRLRQNPTFGRYRIRLRLFCHDARMDYPKANGNRLDLLYEVLKDLFDGNQKFGFANLEMDERIEDVYDKNFNIIELVYYTNDITPSAAKKVGSFK